MTMTINETTTAPEIDLDNAVIVQDLDALAALPVGTLLKEIDCDDFDRIEVAPDGRVTTNEGAEKDSMPFKSLYLPAAVLNPEILGKFDIPTAFLKVGDRAVLNLALGDMGAGEKVEVIEVRSTGVFDYTVKSDREGTIDLAVYARELDLPTAEEEALAEWEKELLAPGIEVGDRVEITGTVPGCEGFLGMFGEVVNTMVTWSADKVWVQPETPRPDGFNLSKFAWPLHQLTLAPKPAFQVGDTVKITAATFAEHVIGKTGTVTQIAESGALRTYMGIDHPYEVRVDGVRWFASGIERVEKVEKVEKVEHPTEVGQRVEVIDAGGDGNALLGAKGTVVSIVSHMLIGVEQDHGVTTQQFNYRFKVIEEAAPVEEPQFKAGDRVTITYGSKTWDGPATVVRHDGLYVIVDADASGLQGGFHPSELTPLVEPRVLAVGDVIETVEELDSLTYGSVVMKGHDSIRPHIRLRDGEWFRLNMLATRERLAKIANREKGSGHMYYSGERENLAHLIREGGEVKVLHIA